MAKNAPLKNEPLDGGAQTEKPSEAPPVLPVDVAPPPVVTAPETQDTTVRFQQSTPPAATQVIPGERPFRAPGCDLGEGHRCIAHRVEKVGETGLFYSCARAECPNNMKMVAAE